MKFFRVGMGGVVSRRAGAVVLSSLRLGSLFIGIGIGLFVPTMLEARLISVVGKVVANADSRGLSNTLLSVLDVNGNVVRTAVSDRKGDFSFSIDVADDIANGDLVLKVESLGYEPQTLVYQSRSPKPAAPEEALDEEVEETTEASSAGVTTTTKVFTEGTLLVRLDKIRKLREYVVRKGSRLSDKERQSISTTTLTEEDVESLRIRDVRDLTAVSANLFSLNSESAFGSFFSLRGISSINTFDPLLVFYIDDVARFQSQNVPLHLFNVESIQILKGPQLTLYGRNAMAGVIDIKTKKPDKPFAVAISTEGELPFVFSSPLAPELNNPFPFKGKLNLFFSTPLGYKDSYFRSYTSFVGTDGFVRNTAFNKYTGGELSWDTAIEFILPLTIGTTMTLIGKYGQSEKEIYPYAETIEAAFATPYQVEHNLDNFSKRETGEFTMKFSAEFKYLNLLSTTTYHNFLNRMLIDADFSLDSLGEVSLDFKQNVFTQEIRITSTSLSEQYFSWLVGVYFYLKDEDYGLDFELFPAPLLPPATVIRGSELATGTAIFNSLTFPLLPDTVALIVGNRLDIETRRHKSTNRANQDENNPAVSPGNPLITTNDERFLKAYYTGKLALTSVLLQGLEQFVSFATGFRSGGINLFTTQNERLFYNREYSLHTELGFRGTFAPIDFSLGFFYIYWLNQQFTQAFTDAPGIFEFGIINLDGPSHNYGIEYEMDWRIPYGFGIDTVIGYTESTRVIYTPKLTLAVGLRHSYEVRNGFFRNINRLEYRFLPEVFFELSKNDNLKQSAYGLLNFSSSFYISKSFFVSLWMKNILDERYIAFVLPFGKLPSRAGSRQLEATKLGDPATFGFKVSYTF
ncbi:hypothetical protein COTS27_01529 [Spirochaetota bacterium]|nr:hypothetical protein COTS27_01529 [Spirochaetota bacterium]